MVMALARPSSVTAQGLGEVVAIRGLVQGRPQFDAQVGVHGTQQVLARLAAAELKEAPRMG